MGWAPIFPLPKDNDMDLLSLKDGSRLKAYPVKQLGEFHINFVLPMQIYQESTKK